MDSLVKKDVMDYVINDNISNSMTQDKTITKEQFEVIKNEPKKQEIGVIGIPHTGIFPHQTTMSLNGLIKPANHIIMNHMIGSCLVYDARDQIINFAEENNADWVLMVDSDMVLPNDTLVKLVCTTLEGERLQIASGMCFKRTRPHQPCFYTKARINPETKKPELETPVDFPDKGLLECQGFGMACTLIRRHAWQAIRKKTGHLFFPFPNLGEDLSFCIRARMAGIKMYTDLSINVGHVSNYVVYKESFFKARDEHFNKKDGTPLFK